MEPIKALKKIKKITMDYFTAAHMAPNDHKPVVYCNVFTPVELIYAMDMFPVYPENHAAIIGARKMTTELSSAAEGMGYVMDLCSYARCDIGSIKLGMSPTWGLPKPDLILVINCQCGTLTKWFEVLSRKYNAPMVLIDIPHSGNGEHDVAAETYVRNQLEGLIKTLESISGKSLDEAKFKEVMNLSKQASELWTKMLIMGEQIPAPMTVFDQFVSMFPIVSQRGTETAVNFYGNLVQELEERVAMKIPAVDNEKFRLFWDNLPIWSDLSKLSGFLAERRASVVTSIYTWAWSQLAVNEEDPLSDWTRQYLYTFNLNFDYRVEKYIELARRYRVDGFLFHSNRSCKWISQDVFALRDTITKSTGIPGVIFEADQNDTRLYSFENLEKQIESFLELLETRSGHV